MQRHWRNQRLTDQTAFTYRLDYHRAAVLPSSCIAFSQIVSECGLVRSAEHGRRRKRSESRLSRLGARFRSTGYGYTVVVVAYSRSCLYTVSRWPLHSTATLAPSVRPGFYFTAQPRWPTRSEWAVNTYRWCVYDNTKVKRKIQCWDADKMLSDF